MTSRTSPALASLVTATQATLQEAKIRAPAAAVPILVAAHNSVAPTVLVLSNEHEAEHMVAACEGYIPRAAIASFPAWETLFPDPGNSLSPYISTPSAVSLLGVISREESMLFLWSCSVSNFEGSISNVGDSVSNVGSSIRYCQVLS